MDALGPSSLALTAMLACAVACGSGTAPEDHASGATGDSASEPEPGPGAASSTEPEAASDGDPPSNTEPASDTGLASDSGPASGTEAGRDTDESADDCVALAMKQVDHVAFSGDGFAATCNPAHDNAVLITQDQVDAHAEAYCRACAPADQCPNAPKLPHDSMLLYAFTGTPNTPADLEILSVEDCGGTIVVTADATMENELALGAAWTSVTVPALAKPVEFHIEVILPR